MNKKKTAFGVTLVVLGAIAASLLLYIVISGSIHLLIQNEVLQPFCNSQYHYTNCE